MALRSTIKERYRFGDIIGKSPVIQAIYERIIKAAASDVNVLIYGESGTGKDLIAHTIHQLSKRHNKAFVPVNCGAVPDTLFEREFFGHRKGAFTGAYADTSGFFDRAHGGTLFLDEVSEIPQNIQVKLLRVLESGEYTSVGSNRARTADTRVIAATNKSFEELTRNQTLREDFFYRIHVISITVPPLRERKEDIALLIEYFMNHHGYDKQHPTLPGEILGRLYAYHWPGNIRELQNVLHRYFTVGLLEFRSLHKPDSEPPEHVPTITEPQNSSNLRDAMHTFEKRFILQHLEQNHWHKSRTAEVLGIPRRTLHRKLKQFGIQ
jgi:transcriptional regulator with PAS, ATPase and Fis domain